MSSRTHLSRSRLSLAQYEAAVKKLLRGGSLRGAKARLALLSNWRAGRSAQFTANELLLTAHAVKSRRRDPTHPQHRAIQHLPRSKMTKMDPTRLAHPYRPEPIFRRCYFCGKTAPNHTTAHPAAAHVRVGICDHHHRVQTRNAGIAARPWQWPRRAGRALGKLFRPARKDATPHLCAKSTVVQSLMFDRNVWTEKSAMRWARAHKLAPLKAAESGPGQIHVRILPPSRFSFLRTITFGKGIQAHVGCPCQGGKRRR